MKIREEGSGVKAGDRFGRLVVLGWQFRIKGQYRVVCQCDCGERTLAYACHLHAGSTVSCGCYRLERVREVCATHGESGTILYSRWGGMKDRCYNKNCDKFAYYGGRGIEVCKEWHAYEPFRDWARANGYQDHLEIDRKDNNKGYCPGNCRWVTKQEQVENRDYCIHITHQGKTQTAAAWSKELGINKSCLYARLNRYEWDPERALTTANRHDGRVLEYNGLSMNVSQWAEHIGCNPTVLFSRLNRAGWSVEKTLSTPVGSPIRDLEYQGRSQSISAWAREMGMPAATLSGRINRSGWTIEKALETPVKRKKT